MAWLPRAIVVASLVAVAPGRGVGESVGGVSPDAAHIDADAAIALARPLFAPTRRPAPEPARGTAPTGIADAPPCLRGTIVSPAGATALFGATADVIARHAGEAIGAWRIEAIKQGEARLTGPAETRTTAVSFCGAALAAVATVVTHRPARPVELNDNNDETPQLPASVANPKFKLAPQLRRR